MNKIEAATIIINIIPEASWNSFTDWAEEFEECDHDESSYEPWLEENGSADPAGESEKLYEAMGIYAGTGPCACAAGQGLFGYPSALPAE